MLIGLFSVWDPNAADEVAAVSEPVAVSDSGVQSSDGTLPPAIADSVGKAHSRRMKGAFDDLTDSVICAGLIFY